MRHDLLIDVGAHIADTGQGTNRIDHRGADRADLARRGIAKLDIDTDLIVIDPQVAGRPGRDEVFAGIGIDDCGKRRAELLDGKGHGDSGISGTREGAAGAAS